MARPYWSGQIQISLVSFGVKLFVATEAKSEIRFHQISRKTGERVKYQKVSASAAEAQQNNGEDTPASAIVEKDEIVKGYEYRKGEYVTIEPQEIANLRVPSKHTVDITQFVGLDELAPEYLEKPYFVVPDGDAQAEAFATVREALRQGRKAALGKIAFAGREHVLAITANSLADEDVDLRGMMAYTMRYKEEFRDPAEYFRDIKKVSVNEDSLELAQALIQKRSSKFDPGKFTDGYEIALKELVEAKVNHAPLPKDERAAPARGKVVNLMDALRKSISGDAELTATKKAPARETPRETKAEPKQGLSLVQGAPPTAKAGKASSTRRKSA